MSKLINSSVIDKVGFRPSTDIADAIEREIEYRKNLKKIFLASTIFLLSVSLLYLVPLYPVPIVFLFSIVSAVIGFRSVLTGFLFSFFLFIPAYLYQTSVPFWWLLINLFIIGVVLAKSTQDSSHILALVFGIISGLLFLTPYYFVSIPLMLLYGIVRKDSEFFRNTGLLFGFLFIFIPFNALAFSKHLLLDVSTMTQQTIYNKMIDSSLPLFTQIIYDQKSRLVSFDIPVIVDSFSGLLTIQNNLFNPFLYILIDKLVLLFIPILLVLSFSIMGVLERIWPWMEAREVELSILPRYSSIISLILGTAFFIIPLQTMQIPFDYYTSFDSLNSIKSLSIAGALGLVLSLSSINLSNRYEGAELTESVKANCIKSLDIVDESNNQLNEILSVCPGIDINAEFAQMNEYKEELSITLDVLDTLSYKGLKEKSEKLFHLSDGQSSRADSISFKVLNYHNDQLDQCQKMLKTLDGLGINNLPSIDSTHLSYNTETSFTDVLANQRDLNDFLIEVSQNTIKVTESLVGVVQKEFDTTLEPTSISISNNFIHQGKGQQALESLIVTIQSLHKRYHRTMEKTIGSLKRLIQRSIKIHESHVLPLNESLGQNPYDEKTGSIAKEINLHFDELQGFQGILYLPDVMYRLEFLESGTHTVISELLRLLREFEKRNDSRVPMDFHWGKDTQLISEIESSLRRLDDQSKTDLSDRLSNIEYGIKIIENEANTLKKYLIMNEFILNYVNMEPLISSLISIEGKVLPKQLPVKSKYAIQYLQLFAFGKSKITFNAKTDTLTKITKN